MKRILWIPLWLICAALVFAATEDIGTFATCKHCGMDREKFSHSRMVIQYEDGSAAGICSLHCAAVELALNIDKTPSLLQVGDFGNKTLIDAEKAVWVVGGAKKGVMTRVAKWAFERKADAEKFVAENGGEIATLESAIKSAYADMYEDTRMIREKRKMMKQQQMPDHKH
ncbi:MAG: nitrous oxide reductase accessory protein NosL [Nitrospirota bacterium]|nr:nitrous oxide reductase accessory protein NosL [Nitrospirota bacterium]